MKKPLVIVSTVGTFFLPGCTSGHFNPANEKCLESKRVPVTYYTCDEFRSGTCVRQSPQTRWDNVCARWQCKPGYENNRSGNCVKPTAR
jgi:hypothetical protein